MNIDVTDSLLWGNEAGEDESPENLNGYFIVTTLFSQFISENDRFRIGMSKKGVGKSTLLRKSHFDKSADDNNISVYVKASDLAALLPFSGETNDDLINGWLRRICTKLNHEIANRINFAFGDTNISLVENAELAGFRGRNLLSALLDRLSLKTIGSAVERKRLATADNAALFMRWQEKNDYKIWIFIDDIDATFTNTPTERLRISAFLNACRNLVRDIDGVFVRSSIRTDVWGIIRQSDESMDKINQYIAEIHWTADLCGRMLISKIKNYLRTRNPGLPQALLAVDPGKISQMIFDKSFPWGGGSIAPYEALYVFSYGRPRWESQLCKLASRNSYQRTGTSRGPITWEDIQAAIPEYGRIKVDDLFREHAHQFPRIVDVIEIFSGGSRRYTTRRLLELITKKYIEPLGSPEIDGKKTSSNPAIDIARFLYRIGLISARNENCDNPPQFIRFEDRPNLLTTKVNLDDGMDWEIHPSYRGYLRIGHIWPTASNDTLDAEHIRPE